MMSTTWFIAKEYLKRMDVSFEEHGRKTFSLHPYALTETKEIEVFPGKNWITLTTRLMDLSNLSKKERSDVYEKLLKANASLVEVNFGIDKKRCLMTRSVIPVTGISYDAFNSMYDAHLAGIKFWRTKLAPALNIE